MGGTGVISIITGIEGIITSSVREQQLSSGPAAAALANATHMKSLITSVPSLKSMVVKTRAPGTGDVINIISNAPEEHGIPISILLSGYLVEVFNVREGAWEQDLTFLSSTTTTPSTNMFIPSFTVSTSQRPNLDIPGLAYRVSSAEAQNRQDRKPIYSPFASVNGISVANAADTLSDFATNLSTTYGEPKTASFALWYHQ